MAPNGKETSSVFAEAIAGGENRTPKCQPVNVSNADAASLLPEYTLEDGAILSPGQVKSQPVQTPAAVLQYSNNTRQRWNRTGDVYSGPLSAALVVPVAVN